MKRLLRLTFNIKLDLMASEMFRVKYKTESWKLSGYGNLEKPVIETNTRYTAALSQTHEVIAEKSFFSERLVSY